MKAKALTLLIISLCLAGCVSRNEVNPRLAAEMPGRILWAWERPEDLRFIDPKEYAVAFLAQTLTLESSSVSPKPRRQPLEAAPGTYMIAVTRIETVKAEGKRPTFDAEMLKKAVRLVLSTLDLPEVRGVQIDFDAVVSERPFYRSLLVELRKQMPTATPLTMTSLASWCTGDAWFNDFPVDEAVPMAFQMGADSDKIKKYLRNGSDWTEPLCRGSYGISLEEGPIDGMRPGRRTYYFKNGPWQPADLEKLPR